MTDDEIKHLEAERVRLMAENTVIKRRLRRDWGERARSDGYNDALCGMHVKDREPIVRARYERLVFQGILVVSDVADLVEAWRNGWWKAQGE